MKAPLRLMPPWSKEQLAHIREIQRDFHVRAFGEELARVNLDMTIEERHRYLDWMRELARQNGVPRERAHSIWKSPWRNPARNKLSRRTRPGAPLPMGVMESVGPRGQARSAKERGIYSASRLYHK